MGNEKGKVRRPRGALTARLTCPLCQDHFREACAFTECLHTFCQECIMKKIDDEEINSCPVCNVYLGIAPEEKLRLQDKLLPQMPKIYLRIKDRSMQICSILSYITKKVELASDDKVLASMYRSSTNVYTVTAGSPDSLLHDEDEVRDNLPPMLL